MIFYDKDRKKYRVSVNQKIGYNKYKRIWRTASTAREAKAIEAELRLQVSDSANDETIRFREAYKSYINKKAETKRKTTVEFHETVYRIYIEPVLGSLKLNQVTYIILNEWKAGIPNDLSLGRRCAIYTCLHSFFKFADAMYGTSLVPVLNRVGQFATDPNKVTKKVRKLEYWNPAEFEKFSTALRKICEKIPSTSRSYLPHWSTYVLLSICFYCGLRRGEANALTIADFHDGAKPYLDINKSVTLKTKGEAWLITDPKNKASVRCVPVPQRLRSILVEHINERLARLPVPFSPELFLVGGMRPLADQTCDSIKEQIEKDNNIRHIHVHGLRHSYATVLINNGVQPNVIQKLCGHANLSITLAIYAHLYPKTLTDAIDIFDSLISPPTTSFDISSTR